MIHFTIDFACAYYFEFVVLFIDINKPYLGATPDGLLGTDSIVEVKCPASAAAHTPIEAIRLKKIKFCIETGDGIKLKKTHR